MRMWTLAALALTAGCSVSYEFQPVPRNSTERVMLDVAWRAPESEVFDGERLLLGTIERAYVARRPYERYAGSYVTSERGLFHWWLGAFVSRRWIKSESFPLLQWRSDGEAWARGERFDGGLPLTARVGWLPLSRRYHQPLFPLTDRYGASSAYTVCLVDGLAAGGILVADAVIDVAAVGADAVTFVALGAGDGVVLAGTGAADLVLASLTALGDGLSWTFTYPVAFWSSLTSDPPAELPPPVVEGAVASEPLAARDLQLSIAGVDGAPIALRSDVAGRVLVDPMLLLRPAVATAAAPLELSVSCSIDGVDHPARVALDAERLAAIATTVFDAWNGDPRRRDALASIAAAEPPSPARDAVRDRLLERGIELFAGTPAHLALARLPIHDDGPRWRFLARTEITAATFDRVMGTKLRGGRDLPATRITVEEAAEFCARLGNHARTELKLPLTFRLPTRDEWRAAAQAGGAADAVLGAAHAAPVASRRADANGFFDLFGNVAELVVAGPDQVVAAGGAFSDGQGGPDAPRRPVKSGERSEQVGLRVVAELR